MKKYVIAIKIDNKGEVYEFDNKQQRQDFMNSLDGNMHVKDVLLSEYEDTALDKPTKYDNFDNQLTQIKIKEVDAMFNLTQTLFMVLVMVHSWYGNDVFPILCLIAINTIADRYFNWKKK